MAKIRISGDTSGYVELTTPAVAGSTSLSLPATTGTVPVLRDAISSGEASTLQINTRPWNMPWGVIGIAEKTSNQGSITNIATDVTNMSITFNQVSGRRYKITTYIQVYSSAVGDNIGVKMVTGSTVYQEANGWAGAANNQISICLVGYRSAASSASVTDKIQVVRATGSGTVTVFANSTYPSLLIIEDIGAA